MYGYCWWVAGPSDELGDIGIAHTVYSAIGLGGNFLTVLPDIGTVVTVVTGSSTSPAEALTNDDYQALLGHLAAALS